MNQMSKDFGDRLEKQHVNDHGRVQIRSERRKFNVTRAVRWVNNNMDEFVADNTYMNDVDFEDVSVGHEKHFG
jgi:hypothetical protein